MTHHTAHTTRLHARRVDSEGSIDRWRSNTATEEPPTLEHRCQLPRIQPPPPLAPEHRTVVVVADDIFSPQKRS